MRKIILLIVFLLFIQLAYAQEGHLKLLAVSENDDGKQSGSEADLYLKIVPGTGKVFIDTFPLTKFDTQISTRLAKDIACDFLDVSCNNFDFFYTIRAQSATIGGPSAGSSITILTIAVLDDIKINESIASTGTINAGGLIGPVGGLKAKIEIAGKIGIEKILIPSGERFIKEGNFSLDLVDYAKGYNLTVVEVSDIVQALHEFTGKKYKEEDEDININPKYEETMQFTAEDLCKRSNYLKESSLDISIKENITILKEIAINFSEKGKEAIDDKRYYSAASFCFGANIKYRQIEFMQKEKEIDSIIIEFREEIEKQEKEIEEKEINTITDLQIYMAVNERIIEAKDFLSLALDSIEKNNSLHNYYLAYGTERLYSAKAWAYFFGANINKGKTFNFNKQILRNSCQTKLYEADERYHYVNYFFPGLLENTKKNIDLATEYSKEERYELCLYEASKAKAEADVILSVFGVSEDQFDNLIQNKIRVTKKNLAKEIDKGIFPILGYSYFEYANSLAKDDKYSSLLYLEYTLEMSNFDMYFKDKTSITLKDKINFRILIVFFSGFLLGILCLLPFLLIKKKKPGKSNKRKK